MCKNIHEILVGSDENVAREELLLSFKMLICMLLVVRERISLSSPPLMDIYLRIKPELMSLLWVKSIFKIKCQSLAQTLWLSSDFDESSRD